MLKVLVIDDNEKNIQSARETLQGCELTTYGSIQEFWKNEVEWRKGEKKTFDVVLTDLFMPIGDFNGAMSARKVGDGEKEFPAGVAIALRFANKGIPTVIYSDTNHHADWMTALLDMIGEGIVVKTGACFVDNDRGKGKDWRPALAYLLRSREKELTADVVEGIRTAW